MESDREDTCHACHLVSEESLQKIKKEINTITTPFYNLLPHYLHKHRCYIMHEANEVYYCLGARILLRALKFIHEITCRDQHQVSQR
jgi:hypothetical protein